MTKMLSIGILKKVRKNKNPCRSFNPHGYVNNNTVCSSLCYINVRLKIQNIFDLGIDTFLYRVYLMYVVER